MDNCGEVRGAYYGGNSEILFFIILFLLLFWKPGGCGGCY
jgi:hypothetical protein